MPVTNIECQIARGQIGRYLAGDRFSAEAVAQLEEHISECPGCKAFLSDRKSALQAMMGGAPSPCAVIEVPMDAEPAPAKAPEAKKADAKVAAKPTAKPKPVSASTFTKPTMYALALAAVLVGMNIFAKASPMLLGPKASASSAFTNLTSTTPTATAPKVTGGPVPPPMQTPTTDSPSVAASLVPSDPTFFGTNPTPVAPEKTTEGTPKSETNTPVETPKEEPKTTPKSSDSAKPVQQPEATPAKAVAPKPKVVAPEVKVTSHRIVHRRRTSRAPRRKIVRHARPAAPKASGNSIRVYDAKGNPIQ